MKKNYLGFALAAVVTFAACQAIFNKDKADVIDSTGSAAAAVVKPRMFDSVKAPEVTRVVRRDSNLRYVYLTFDDGPDAGTLNCYNVCQNKGVRATFFLVGEHADYRHGRNILETMRKDMRHFIFANHSYSHANNRYEQFYRQEEKALRDFMRFHDSMQFSYPIARFPGNPAWVMEDHKIRTSKLTKPLTKLMDSIGYNVMGWDVEWNFDKSSRPVQSAEQMARQIMNAFESNSSFVKNHVVLLTHDRMFREPNYRDSLAKMITILQSKKGVVFETADQYPLIKKNDRTLLAVRQ
ncbi:MAG: polysaccharide deacetylase family protein [Chitinophagaceae bacterium]|jgi:peptidoglycan/xylan/chitin deacetylase (PgdA/CDA1 family)|nr:polysaccharide deacetylase family protein [Chitinophagaceae bacterium]